MAWPAIAASAATSLLSSQNKGGGGGIFDSLDITNKNIQDPWARGIANILGGFGLGALFGGEEEGMSQEEMFEREFAERKKPAEFRRAPEYGETKGAREAWWGKLQEGAIPEDWGDIWSRAKEKYSQYYWGSPGGAPGVAGKVRASAARRGVSGSPALETAMGRMGMEEAGGLKDIDIAKIKGGMDLEQNWMQNIKGLANLQVPGTWDKYGGMAVAQPTAPTPMGDFASAAGGYLAQTGQQGDQDWWQNMLKNYKPQGPGGYTPTTQKSITGGPAKYEEFQPYMYNR